MLELFTKSFLKEIAKIETVPLKFLEQQVKKGLIVVPASKARELNSPFAIGEGLRVKLNTNIGTSTDKSDIKNEIKKMKVAVEYGSHAIMDLSTGGDLRKMRKQVLKQSPVMVGTVPLYEIAQEAERKKGSFEKMTIDDVLEVIELQAKEGVDFFTIHAGILQKTLKYLQKNKRVGGVVSRGGAILARWMHVNNQENLLYENFDKILDIMKKYRVTMSLGDALRPGAIADSTDYAQIEELNVLSELIKKCHAKKVQVMVEGPGHIRLDEIAKNVHLQKKLCHRAPFYVLGPLPTDIACGYDHITSAIGGAIAALNGVDFLCVVTPAEHLRQPSVDDVRDGVMASRIAAHSVDVLRFKDEWMHDKKMSEFRAKRDWNNIFDLAMDKKKAKEYRKSTKPSSVDLCTMCGKFCSLKIIDGCDLLK